MPTFKVYYWNRTTNERDIEELVAKHPDAAREKFYGNPENAGKRILKVKVKK